MRSKATAEMRTPEPKAITDATTFAGTLVSQAISAPMTSAPPPSRPHSPASSQVGIRSPVIGGSAPCRGPPRACEWWGAGGPLSVGVAQQVAAEVRDGEGDLPSLGG